MSDTTAIVGPDADGPAPSSKLKLAASLLRPGAGNPADAADDPFAGFAPERVDRSGESVGPYVLERLLGRGGMGAVYAARRVQGEFEQRVALKLLRVDRGGHAMIGRFRREREILARLQHPHIAHLLDGGIAATGEPWFALELVDGLPIVQHAAQARLGLGDRLQLFLMVCDAVAYAHRFLVVHRDLKPSNILVDRTGQVKLLDFGIAKLVDDGVPGSGALTQADERVLTPDYAAPEQILGEPVTTAADVYALGLLLFELLTGQPAHAYGRLGLGEAARRIESEPAIAPSRTLAESSGRTEPDTRGGLRADDLRGDLDAIVLKALRREPAQRYASVGDLAQDLQRHLAGYPVLARNGRASYRIGRAMRRHRVLLSATVLVLLSLVGGLVATLWQARAARQEADRANAVKALVLDMFHELDPEVPRAHELSAREMLDAGARRLESRLDQHPELQFELQGTLGRLYAKTGEVRSALPLLERARALARAQYGPDDARLSAVELDLASARMLATDFAGAERHCAEAERLDALSGKSDDEHRSRLLNLRATLAVRSDRFGDADRHARALVALEERRGDGRGLDFARALSRHAWVLMWSSRYPEAEATARRALEVSTSSGHDAAADGIGGVRSTLVNILSLQGRNAEAFEMVDAYHRAMLARLGDSHAMTIGARVQRATQLSHIGRLAESERELRAVMDARETMTEGVPFGGGLVMWVLGENLYAQGRAEEARAMLERGMALIRKSVGDTGKMALLVESDLGAVLAALGDVARSERTLAHARAGFEGRRAHDPDPLDALQSREAELLLARGDARGAVERIAQPLRNIERRLGPDHYEVTRARAVLGNAHLALRAFEAAEAELGLAHAGALRRYGAEDPRVLTLRFRHTQALDALGRKGAARELRASAEALAGDARNQGRARFDAIAWLAGHRP